LHNVVIALEVAEHRMPPQRFGDDI
jgi:hypothetical protein